MSVKFLRSVIVSGDCFSKLQLTLFKVTVSTRVQAHVMCKVVLPVETAEMDQKGFEMCFSTPWQISMQQSSEWPREPPVDDPNIQSECSHLIQCVILNTQAIHLPTWRRIKEKGPSRYSRSLRKYSSGEMTL